METKSLLGFPGAMTLLIVVLGALLLLTVIGSTEDASAATWGSEHLLDATSGLDWESVDSDGTSVYIAYTKVVGGTPFSYLMYYDGDVWSSPLPVSGAQVLSRNVRMVADADVVYCVYEDWTDADADILYTTFNVKTGAWSRGVPLSSSNPGVDARYPCIDIDNGTVHVAWQEDLDGDQDIYYRSGSGLTWSTTEKLSQDLLNEDQILPDLDVFEGEVHVVWREMRRIDNDVSYRHYNGTWNAVTDVSRDNEDQTTPKVAVSDTGVHVIFSTFKDPFWHTYMTTYTGTWDTPTYVGRTRATTTEDNINLKAEGGNLVLMYRTTVAPNNIVIREYINGRWNAEQNVFTSPSGSFFGFDIDLAGGVLHLAYTQYNATLEPFEYKYISTDLDGADPWAIVDPVDPYWMDGGRMHLSWRAQDDYGLATVTVQYRYSSDNSSWDRWTALHTFDVSGYVLTGLQSFAPGDGDGFYEFKAYATDIAGKSEPPSVEPEAMAGLDLVDPSGRIVINDGDAYTANSTVNLTLTYADATSGVIKVRFGEEAIGGDEPWEDPVDFKEWTIGAAEGEHTVAYQVMDRSGRLSPVYTDSISLDLTDPTGSITIDGGAIWATTPDVDLGITYEDSSSGVAGVRFNDEAIGGDEPWEDPVDTKRWTLPEGEGLHTVAYQVMDAAGRTSEVYTAQIGLDTVAPTGSIVIEGGDTITSETTVTLLLTYADATSGVAGVHISEEAVGGDEPWDNPLDTKEWDLGTESGRKTMYYQVIDVAGLVSDVYSVEILLDVDKPTGSIALASGATSSNSATVTLALGWDDVTSDVVGMRVLQEAVGGDEPWDNPLETMELTLTGGDGVKNIYYQVIDAAGQESVVYKLTLTLDTTNPFTDSVEPGDGATDVKPDVTIVVRFSEPMDGAATSGATKLQRVVPGGSPEDVPVTITWSPDGRTMTVKPDADLAEGTEYHLTVGADALDALGNALFPTVDHSFTTEGGAGGGDGGDDDGGGSFLVIILAVVIVVVVVGALAYVMMRGSPGGGTTGRGGGEGEDDL